MGFRSSWLKSCMEMCRGRYWRSSPSVFSLLPRCHRLFGSQKWTATPVSTVNRAWAAVSWPWSPHEEAEIGPCDRAFYLDDESQTFTVQAQSVAVEDRDAVYA